MQNVPKIGDIVFHIQTGLQCKVVEVKPHFIGKFQCKIQRLDTMSIIRLWINGKKFTKNFASGKMAHILFDKKKVINKQTIPRDEVMYASTYSEVYDAVYAPCHKCNGSICICV